MCGHFGILLPKPAPARNKAKLIRLFNALGVLSQKRGSDATGAAILQRAGSNHLFKDVYPAQQMVDMSRWKEFLREYITGDTCALLGHTRYGTHGSNSPGNAHPFLFPNKAHGELIGAHNGVITNHDLLLPNAPGPYASDSANLFWALSQVPEAEFVDVLRFAVGSYALVFRRKSELYLVRNEYSPLVLSRVPELGAVIYASEPAFLRKAGRLLGLRVAKPKSLNPNRLYAINLLTCDERTVDYTPEYEEVSLQQELELACAVDR